MDKPFKPKTNVLRLIPLGGIGDVTKNMYIYEYGNDILIIDCGIGFPDEAMPGIDLVIPDITYLKDKRSKIRGIVITHGHEDHIGGLPFVWPDLDCPIYAQKLTSAFIKNKFTENNIPKDKINTITPETKLSLGVFNISFYRISHSVPDSTGIIIETPVGTIIHQGDFKLDWTPVTGPLPDLSKLTLAGQAGVNLMLIDALRAEKPGYNLSEKTIEPTFRKIEGENKNGKIIITTTSSNISRIQQAVNVAIESGRKVAVIGRSMETNFQTARDLGYLHIPPGLVVAPDEVKRFADSKLLLIIAGAFGQAGSALSRVANNDHRFVVLKNEDAVVFSADPIPSTESAQYALIDKLTKMGANVYYTSLTDDLHVSGHAASEEIKLMLSLANPKHVMPIGATFRGMKAFARLTEGMGWQRDEIILAEDGQVIEVSKDHVRYNGRVEAKNVYVDGLGVGDVGNIVLRDRRVMAEEGVVLIIVPVDAQTSQIVGEPDIISRGFVFEKEAEGLLDEAKQVVKNALSDHPKAVLDWRFTRRHIEEKLEEFFYHETKRRPMILPVVVEV